jgi:flagellar hook-associated protein 3 FlgL
MRVSTSLINMRAVNGMLDQQARLSELQQQLSTGKRIQSPADDPIGSARGLSIDQSIAVTQQYKRNSDVVRTRLQLEDNILSNVSLVLNRAREVALQGNNSSATDSDRQILAKELKQRLEEILSLANTRNTNGEYIYSGFQVKNQPFSMVAGGGYSYSGDDGQRMIQISPSRTIALGNSGRDVFVEIKNGNGHFTAADDPTNAGTGVIDGGTLANGSSWVQDTYSITFTSDTTFEVRDSGGALVLADNYTDGGSISFNGVNTSIKGQPATGDVFTIAPSTSQDVFSTIQNLIGAFGKPTTGTGGTASLNNSVNRFLNDIDQALENVQNSRASVGARLNAIDSQNNVNETQIINDQENLSTIRDIDYVKAVSDLNLQQVGLESAQKAYLKIQGLSLFNYL